MSRAVDDVAAERSRQKEYEGWSPEHDDQHSDSSMVAAAASYAMHYVESGWLIQAGNIKQYQSIEPPYDWPWLSSYWKPKDPRHDLVRAAALIIAEIERLDRMPS